MYRLKAREVLRKLVVLRARVAGDGGALYNKWAPGIAREAFHPSARNLAHYLALRREDLRQLQWELIPLGLSSLGRLEARVMPTLNAVIASCAAVVRQQEAGDFPLEEDFTQGEAILDHNSQLVLGPEPDSRYTRVMVTLPTEAARDEHLIEDLVARGMEIARINCSHDDEEHWAAMIAKVREAGRKLGRTCLVSMEVPGPKVRIDRVLSELRRARVFAQDKVFLTAGRAIRLPRGIHVAISCSIPEIISHLTRGEVVMIDDGHIEAVCEDMLEDGVVLRVTRVINNERGVLLRPEKGLNFPGVDYRIPLLSPRDQEIMHFVCAQADIIGCSFVRDQADIDILRREINARLKQADSKPIIIKIETLEALRALPDILVRAAGHVPIAVMIARGDLAVEVGYARLSEYQEEILWICEAAHVPVIWATQVVETLVKTGIPTRAEISDVTLAAKSECIMLNKGPHVGEAVTFVADILSMFEHHVYKKTSILRQLTIAREQFQDL